MTTPVMLCPKCTGAMRTYERAGVTVDQCTECRGIFLDRGEIEHLIDAEAKITGGGGGQAAGGPPAAPGAQPVHVVHSPPGGYPQPGYTEPGYREPGHRDSGYRDPGYRHYDDDDDYYRHGGHGKRKKHWLGEIFD